MRPPVGNDKLEAMLDGTPFLLGDRPTLADGVLVGVARWLDFHEVAKPDRWPKLAAVRRRIGVRTGRRALPACRQQ